MIQLYQTLDLRPIGIPQTLRLSQYDSDFEIIFELTNFDGTWILDTNTTAEVQGTKTDGHGYSADAVFDDQLKTVTIAGDVQMTAAAGRNVFEVVLFHDGDRLGSKNFILDVERAALDAETTASDSKIKNFTEMVEAAEDAAETATAAAEAAEEAATGLPAVKAEVENIRIGVDGTTYASAGDAVRGQISDVKADLIDIGYTEQVGANLLNPAEVEPGRITSSHSDVQHTGTYDTDYKTTGFMPVEAGKKYGFYVQHPTLGIIGIGVQNIWAYKGDKTGLSHLGSISQNNDALSYVTAPANAAYLRASIAASIFSTYSIVMCAEADGVHPPAAVVAYQTYAYLDGYVRDQDLEAVEAEVSDINEVIDDNFVDNYTPLTGTTTDDKYINGSGVVSDISSAYTINTFTVSPNQPIKVTATAYSSNYYFAFYTSSDNFISGLKAPSGSVNTSISDYDVVAPESATKLVAVGYNDYASANGVTSKVVASAKPWTGKKWVAFGDSLTELNNRTTKHYYDYVKEATGISTYIMGNGGSGYKREYDLGTAYYQRIDDVPTDADVITIFGSFNDLGASYTLGTATDTGTDTIGGCINETLDVLFETFPLANVGVVTPTPWVGFNPLSEPNNASAYVDLLIAICKRRSIPCLDLFHCSQLRPWESDFRTLAYSKDEGNGVHPDETGHKIIAPRFEAFLDTLLLR